MPTWRGWLLLVVVLGAFFVWAVRGLHSFLAVNAPLPGGILVVEGWAPDFALEEGVQEFRRDHYQKMYVTGGPLEVGAPLSEYKTYAQRGAAILEKLGMKPDEVQAVPAPKVRQDRTYTAAVSLAQWLQAHRLRPAKVYLLTDDTHARRSRLLYEKALGKGVEVGVRAAPPIDYDPRHWWRSSSGFRSVVGETLAYAYARFLFWPSPKAEKTGGG